MLAYLKMKKTKKNKNDFIYFARRRDGDAVCLALCHRPIVVVTVRHRC